VLRSRGAVLEEAIPALRVAHLRLILIAVFGAIGTLARYGLQGLVQVRASGTFPYGTLLVNLSGCFLLGLIGQTDAESLGGLPELAHSHRGWFFRRLHHILQFWAGRRRRCWKMASGFPRRRMLRLA